MNTEEAEYLINWEEFENQDFYIEIIEGEILDKSRWAIRYRNVYKDIRDNTFWQICYDRGATEYQDGTDLNINVKQVFPEETVITVYK